MRSERKIFFRRSIFVLAAFLFIALLFAAPVAAAFSGGSGTWSDPYQITTETDLRQLATDVNGGNEYGGKYFRMENDIRLTSDFTPIGAESGKQFSGYFDGNGHAVSNLKVTDAYFAGLFGSVSSGTKLSNLSVYATDISGRYSAGGLVGNGDGTISNCYVVVSGSVTSSGTDSYTGGLLGKGIGTISNCYAVVSGSITSSGSGYSGYSGGIAGYYNGDLSNCYAVVSGSITSIAGNSAASGGLAGDGGTISNCLAVVSGSITSSGPINSYSGGLVGRGGTISNCYAVVSGSVVTTPASIDSYVGGLVGKLGSSSCSNSVALVSTVGGGSKVGRISGDGSATNCYVWDQMKPASGSTFRTGESYTAVTSANVLKQNWWTTSPGFSTSVWEWTSYYSLPSQKTLPAPAISPLTLEVRIPAPAVDPVQLHVVSCVLDNSKNPLVLMFGAQPFFSSDLTVRSSAANTRPSSGTVMTSLGNGKYSASLTSLSPATKGYWWVTVTDGYLGYEETGSFTVADFTIGTPTHSQLSATGAKVSFTLTGGDVSVDTTPFIRYGTQNDITKSVAVPAVCLSGNPVGTYTAVLSDLTPGTQYYYWAEHAGVTSSSGSFTTSAAAITLNPPTNVATGPGTVTVQFTATVPDGATLADPGILYGTSTTVGNNKNIAAATLISVSGTTATYQATITGLDQNVDYYFWATGSGLQSANSLKASPTVYTLGSLTAPSGDIKETSAKVTFTLTNAPSGAAPNILYSTTNTAGTAISVPAVRTAEGATTYYANLDGLTPATGYYVWAEYNGKTIGGTKLFTTASSAVPTVSVTAARNTPTSATFSITTANGDGVAPVLSYWTDTAKKHTAIAVATGTANTWTVTISDLMADTAYSYSADYSGKTSSTGTLAADASKYTITITSPAAAATGISTSPLILWTISNVDQGLTAVEPKITISGGAGEIIGTTNTGETSGTRTYQTALRGLDLGKTYSLTIEYGGATVSRSFTTETAPAPVTLNAPRLLTGTLTETGAAFLITVDNVADTIPGAVFLLYSTANDPGNATAVTATPGTTQGTTRGYYAALENLVPGTQYYIWSWIEGFTPVELSSGILTDTAEINIDTRFTTITTGSAATITTTGGSGTTNLKWTSDNPAVIQIDRYSGEIIAHKAGKAEITVTGTRPDGSTTTAGLTITVKTETPVSTAGWNAENPVTATVSAGSTELIKIPDLTRGTTTGFISTCPLDTVITLTDAGSSSVPHTKDGNVLKITTPEPGKTYTATFTGRKLGDLDGDGVVDVADALKITRYVAELDTLDDYQLVCGDINSLAGITAKDALAILEYTVGIKNADYRYI